MIIRQLINLHNVLGSVINGSEKLSKKFAYAVTKNYNLIDNGVIKNFNKVADLSTNEQYKAYHQELLSVLDPHIVKDSNGNIQPGPQGELMFKDPTFDSKSVVEQILSRYPGLKQFIENSEKEINDLAESDEDIKLHKVKIDDLPDMIDPKLLVLLECMIDD